VLRGAVEHQGVIAADIGRNFIPEALRANRALARAIRVLLGGPDP
jgi:hypothetical protein